VRVMVCTERRKRAEMRTGARAKAEDLTPRARHRLAIASLLRSMLVASALVLGYFVLPLSSSLAADSALELFAGLALLAVLLIWQVRSILRSPYPVAKGVGVLVVSAPLFLVLFAATYYLMGDAEPAAFSEPLTRVDSMYFTVTVFATVGFGDIAAVTQSARVVTTLQMLSGLVLVGLIARVVFAAVQEGRSRQKHSHPRSGEQSATSERP
jgi:voltage-gated potassium channel